MGQSAEGVVFYGVVYSNDELDEIFPDAEDGESGADLLHAKAYRYLAGKRDRDVSQPASPDGSQYYGTPEWDAWRERITAWVKLQCQTRRAGYSDNSEASYLYVSESYVSAEWSDTVLLKALVAEDEWESRLREYCDAVGLPWKEPGWYLTSHYG